MGATKQYPKDIWERFKGVSDFQTWSKLQECCEEVSKETKGSALGVHSHSRVKPNCNIEAVLCCVVQA